MRDAPTWREALWAHPEWWVVAISISSWGLLVQEELTRGVRASHHHASLGSELLTWHVMVLAMMLPTLALTTRAVALRSLAERRHHAIAAFLVSYLVPWSVFGGIAIAVRQAGWSDSPWTLAILCAAATAWAILPLRERAMMMVHAHSPVIAPDGWRAVRDCTTTGLVVGSRCIASCWPLMLACAFSGHDLAVIAVGGAIGFVESRSFRPPRRSVIAMSAALTVFVAVR